ncbi:hypothetical protein [Paenibacillus donghaensis]|nr:hypothetical protein [Paenibacillus donghaensis]
MNNKTTNPEVDNKEEAVHPGEADNAQEPMSEENLNELLKAVHHNGLVALKMHFKEVEGQLVKLDAYGPVFVFHVKNDAGEVYSCGFFLRELIARFQSGNNPSVWMASFFVDLMKTEGGKALPQPAGSEDEAKAIIDNVLVPKCIAEITEEFAPEQIHAGLAWNEQFGPVFEAGFPAITAGNNVCAIPLHLLYTHLQLNRDPVELLLQGLYNIRKEHGME